LVQIPSEESKGNKSRSVHSTRGGQPRGLAHLNIGWSGQRRLSTITRAGRGPDNKQQPIAEHPTCTPVIGISRKREMKMQHSRRHRHLGLRNHMAGHATQLGHREAPQPRCPPSRDKLAKLPQLARSGPPTPQNTPCLKLQAESPSHTPARGNLQDVPSQAPGWRSAAISSSQGWWDKQVPAVNGFHSRSGPMRWWWERQRDESRSFH